MFEIHTIAHRLVELTRQKKFIEAQQELFATDAVNLEPEKQKDRSVNGLEAILQKETQFNENLKEWNRLEISDPIVAADFFSVQLEMEVTLKNDRKITLNEIIVYEVKNGKIISERFFF